MLMGGDNPRVINFKVDETSVMCDGSSLLQGEDIFSTVAYFIAWDTATMECYLDLMAEEYGVFHVEDMARQSSRRS